MSAAGRWTTVAVAAGLGVLALPSQARDAMLALALERRLAADALERSLVAWAADPASPDAAARHAAALEAADLPAEAAEAFADERGGDWYERRGFRHHANALRWSGQGVAAAALRAEQRVLPAETRHTATGIEVNRIDDLRLAGAWGAALDAADAAEAVAPESSLVQAAIAELMLDLGDTAAMDWHLGLAVRTGAGTYRTQLLLGRIAFVEGRLDAAWEHTERARRQRAKLPELWALRVDILVAQGRVDEALAQLARPRFTLQEHPALMGATVRALVAADQPDQAAELQGRLEQLYPALASHLRAGGFTAPPLPDR